MLIETGWARNFTEPFTPIMQTICHLHEEELKKFQFAAEFRYQIAFFTNTK